MSEKSDHELRLLEDVLKGTAKSILECFLLNLPEFDLEPVCVDSFVLEQGGCCLFATKYKLHDGVFAEVDLVVVNPTEILPEDYNFPIAQAVPKALQFLEKLAPITTPVEQWRLIEMQFRFTVRGETRDTFFGKIDQLRVLYEQEIWEGVRPAPPDDLQLYRNIAAGLGFISKGSA